MGNQSEDYLRGVLEALLFISEKPVPLEQFRGVLPEFNANQVRTCLDEMRKEFEEQRRGMILIEIAGGYQLLSNPHYAASVREFLKIRVKEKLSRPALEVLAIIAYKQPVSRADMELIRGVNSDGVVNHLCEKGLVKIVGRKDVPGRPYLYGTAKPFMEYFGLKSLNDLPKLENFPHEHQDTENQDRQDRRETDLVAQRAGAVEHGDRPAEAA